MSRADIERETRRAWILDAARRLFTEKDLEACTMDDVAGAAEYTRRTLYSYFSTRDELYLLIHLEDTGRRWAMQQEALRGVEGGLARIMVWAETLYEWCREHPQAQRMEIYWDFHGVDPTRLDPTVFAGFETLNGELAEGLRALFHEGVADGSLRPDLDIDMSISQLLYSLRAVIGRALATTYSFADVDPGPYVRHYLDLFSRGIRNSGDA